MEQEKVQRQLDAISAKVNEIVNKKDPVVAFRAAAVKDSGGNGMQSVRKDPGTSLQTIFTL